MAGVTVDLYTRHLPPIRLLDLEQPDGGAASPSSSSSSSSGLGAWFRRALLGWLRPQVVVRHPFGVWERAPYGEPGSSTWPAGAFVVAGLVLFLVVALLAGVFALGRWAAKGR